MSPRGRKPSLAKLQEQQAALAAQIKDLKRQERRDQLELERKRYTVLGRALAKELSENEALAAQLEPILNARITKARERALMNLPHLPSAPPSTRG